jgi:hypothetical protein
LKTAKPRPWPKLWLAIPLTVLASGSAVADGIVVNKVYEPYVQPLETEIEWRSVLQDDDDIPDLRKHAIGIGRSLSDRWFAEFYVAGTRDARDSLDIDLYELEVRWQLTEQGEYAFDWGMVFELEREVDNDAWEFGTTLVSARDFGRWSAVANFGLIYEWGSGVASEIETELHVQTRYRYREVFEPAVELHVGQDTTALGPAFTGLYRFSPGKKLRWNAGVFWGVDEDTPDRIFKLNLEYEF